jgi:hypothetical protein
MPLNFAENTGVVEGTSIVEDALTLVEFLQSHDDAKVDLGSCNHLHTAVLQVLLMARPEIVSLPREAFLARWLSPLLRQPNPGCHTTITTKDP